MQLCSDSAANKSDWNLIVPPLNNFYHGGGNKGFFIFRVTTEILDLSSGLQAKTELLNSPI